MYMKYFLIFFTILFVWGFAIEPHLLTVKKYTIKNDTLKGIKLVFASDFHISRFNPGRLKRVVRLINEQNAALVLLGGDFINGHDGKFTLEIEEQSRELGKLRAETVTVLGNHDGWYDKDRVTKALRNCGIHVLSNSSIKSKGIWIAGVEDIQTGQPDIEKALKDTSSPRILLTHSPDIYYDVKDSVDLILAGHTHGGQVYIPFIGAITVPSIYGPKFAERVIKETKNTMIITKGIGTSIFPVRFCSVPEIVVIEFD